ncbi:hypothetical protein JL721_266 [Aureococcus anophagefferens]|nr:hypothetical protein JL721_266 [Aureococcus anophagefferens]
MARSAAVAAFCCALIIGRAAPPRKPQSVELSRSPYEILGISARATLSQVRNAYRAKARETHPDKHPGKGDEMHRRFLEVVAAFELLSDEDDRRHYDATGRQRRPEPPPPPPPRQRPRRPRALTEGQERAAARAINVRSRKHLEDTALGDDGRVDRHFVLALYDEGECGDFLRYETRFPYPFADKLDPHGIWWEAVLQTAKARLSDPDGSPSRIAKKFGIDAAAAAAGCPFVVFARNGTRLWDDFELLRRPTLAAFEAWMWPKLETAVVFRNEHDHAVRTWWIRGTESYDPQDLAPGQTTERTAFVSHLFATRDLRAGGALTRESVLAWQHIDTDANPFVVTIRSKCVDWQGECPNWAARGECDKNAAFMDKFCHAREDAVALEVAAEAAAVAAHGCDPAYPEKDVRRW